MHYTSRQTCHVKGLHEMRFASTSLHIGVGSDFYTARNVSGLEVH